MRILIMFNYYEPPIGLSRFDYTNALVRATSMGMHSGVVCTVCTEKGEKYLDKEI